MRIYLALYCFNRPYDDQGQTRIRLETEAKLKLLRNLRRMSNLDLLAAPPGEALAFLEKWYEN